MKLIGLSGKSWSGKSTLAELLSFKYGYKPVSFAQSLKFKVMEEFGFTREEVFGDLRDIVTVNGQTPRSVLIKVGQFYRSIDPNYWIKQLSHSIEEGKKVYVVTDVRFQNEANWIKEKGGLLVRLERGEPFLNSAVLDDPSEKGLDDYLGFDFVLTKEKNVDLGDLKIFADFLYYYLEFSGEENQCDAANV